MFLIAPLFYFSNGINNTIDILCLAGERTKLTWLFDDHGHV